MDRETIVIGQCLHGYHNGHSLLASSVELDADSRRILLLMSDMSGPQVLNGFEEYITGYPIKELGSYALAKTWYAGEMQRPGCVWTQTLFVSFSDLPKINQDVSSAILSLFERPDQNLGFYSYQLSKNLVVPINDIYLSEAIDSSVFLKPLLLNLYTSVKTVVVPSESSLKWESTALKIWLQQWPRLQRNFSFCTGSLTLRSFRGGLLDLQVVPFLYKLQEPQRSMVIVSTNTILGDRGPAWLNSIYVDLTSPSPIQSFVRKYGTDVKPSRISFQTLVSTYLFIFHNDIYLGTKNIVDFLSFTFDGFEEANILKTSILGEKAEPEFNKYFQFNENDVLRSLATTPSFKAFDYSKLNFEGRFSAQLIADPLGTLDALNEMIFLDLNPHGEAIIKRLAFESIKYLDILYSDSKFGHLLIIFAQSNPDLSYHPEFWMRNLNSIPEIVRSLQGSKVEWQNVVDTLISLDAVVEQDVFNFDANLIVNCVLNNVNLKRHRPNQSWIVFLGDYPRSLLNWVECNIECGSVVIEVITDLVNPNSKIAVAAAYNAIIILLDNDIVRSNLALNVKVCSFGLALAFSLPIEKSEQLIVRCLDTVYGAAKAERLNQTYWRWIEMHTRPLSWWNEWDKCKKIVKALARMFLHNRPNMNLLYSMIHDREILDRIKKHMDKEDFWEY